MIINGQAATQASVLSFCATQLTELASIVGNVGKQDLFGDTITQDDIDQSIARTLATVNHYLAGV